MMKNHNSSPDKSASKLEKHWWRKVKAIFFAPFKEREPAGQSASILEQTLKEPSKKPTVKDWIKAIDVLQPLVQSVRSTLDPMRMDAFDLDALGVNTYLFHIDRLLVKIREYILNYRYRQEQFLNQTEILSKIEFLQVNEAADQCYQRILKLTDFIQKLPYKKLYSDELINQIHALELETTTLGSAVRAMSQFCYRQEALLQLTQLEQSLLQSLSQTRLPLGGNSLNADGLNSHQMMYSKDEYLRTKSQESLTDEQSEFINEMIDIHEALRKCYVVARKMMVKETLDCMAEGIENLIQVMMQQNYDTNEAFNALAQIFNAVESLRFSTNRESRCSRNLFEKAKIARHQLRKICLKEPVGQAFLKQIEVKRFSLVKPPK